MKKTLPLALLLTLPLLLAACGGTTSSTPTTTTPVATDPNATPTDAEIQAYNPPAAQHSDGSLTAAGLPPVVSSTYPLAPASVRGPASALRAQSLPANAQTNKVGLKILVLASSLADQGLPAATAMLQHAGVPYDVFDASSSTLTSGTLIGSDGAGLYSGVVLTDNALIRQQADGSYASALDTTEWGTLFEYEKAYKVRQLALYGYPGVAPEDYGLRGISGTEGSSTSVQVTAAGQGIFSDLTTNAFPLRYAYSYPSQLVAVDGVSTQPILQDGQGRILAVTSQVDGRERLLLTTAENPYLLHTQLYSYGLLNWLTRGVYLGEYRRFLQVDIDDWFIDGDHFDAGTKSILATPFRLSASDAVGANTRQVQLRKDFPVAGSFRLAVMFNGTGASLTAPASCDPNVKSNDPLTSVSRCLNSSFDWVNHTYSHLRLDITDFRTSYLEIAKNRVVAAILGLKTSDKSLVTGEQSGLGYKDPTEKDPDSEAGPKTDFGLGASNVNMLNAAYYNSVKYIASNHSVASEWDPTCSGCGIVHPLNKTLFLVPRYPTNVYYYVTTPDEATAAYNAVYGPGGTHPFWDHNLNYAEYQDKDSDITLNHILAGEAFPHYMHQPNLHEYAAGRSLVDDWARAALTKYSTYSTLPLKNLSWNDLGAYMQNRTVSLKSGSTAVWDRTTNSVTVKDPAGGALYLTGGTSNVEETYAGLNIARLSMTANGTATITVAPKN